MTKMKMLEDINFDNIHLFEVSVIGKPYNLFINSINFIIIPVYKLVTYNDIEDTVYENSVLVLENVDYFKCEIAYYGSSTREFAYNTKTEIIYDECIPVNPKVFGGIGYYESGGGCSDMAIQFQKAHLLFDKTKNHYITTNYTDCFSDKELINSLTYPNLEKIAKEIKKCLEQRISVQHS